MEIIELSGYTLEEKTEIARRYLVPKQLAANGLTHETATFLEKGVTYAIEGYTREAGVRTLERTIGSICRKIAVRYATDKTLPCVEVSKDKVKELLGAPVFTIDTAALKPQIGAVVGLAWTAVGGTTLTVEATSFTGKGEVKLTGKLGDVMKESALAALSFIRAHADEYGLDSERFSKTDLHIHVPEGATPKDGPSAGITIASAILSTLTGKAARGDIAMTGEITLRGNVLPIGGLKEKALAARRVGIKTVLIPKGNEKDLEKLPPVLKADVEFIPVSTVDEVFKRVFDLEPTPKKRTPKKRATPKPLPIVPENANRDSVRCIDGQ
jgi:ATP-dependent Lon protease